MSIRTALNSVIAWNAGLFAAPRTAPASSANGVDAALASLPPNVAGPLRTVLATARPDLFATTPAPAAPAAHAGVPDVGFVTPTGNHHRDYPAGQPVLKLFNHGLRADLTLGAEVRSSDLAGRVRPATADEITRLVTGWASAVGIDTSSDSAIDAAIGRWARYSANGSPAQAGHGSEYDVAVAKLSALIPGGGGEVVATLLAAIAGPAKAPAAAPPAAAGVKPFSVVVPTQSSGIFTAGEPIFVVARNGSGGWFCLTRGGHGFSPSNGERYVRPATEAEARTALNYLVSQVRAKIGA